MTAHQPAAHDSPIVTTVRLAAALCEHWAAMAASHTGQLAASAALRAQQRATEAFGLVRTHVASNGGVA